MVWTLFLVTTWILIDIDGCNAASHQGTDYALGFVENIRPPVFSSSDAVLYISTQDPRGANVTVEIPNAEAEFQRAGFPMTFTIAQFETRVVEFPTNPDLDIRVMLDNREGAQNKGIHVVSDNEAKLDIVGVNDEKFSTDAFLALPCKLENEPEANFFTSKYQYFIFTAFPASDTSSYFLIIPCTPSGNTGIIYTSPGGDPVLLPPLFQYQTYLVSSGTDLTGTIITSPWPLAVFAGHQCGEIPRGGFPCDHLVEQIPPDITYGTKFFVLPFAVRESGDILRIGSTVEFNEVSITCTRHEADCINSIRTINTGEFVEYRTRDRMQDPQLSSADYRRDYCSIETSQPAIVMQYMLASGEDIVEFEGVRPVGDPAMTLVPPVQQYSNEYTIITPDDHADTENQYHSYIGWAISAEFFNPYMDVINLLVDNAVFWPTASPIVCRNNEVCGYGGVGRIKAGVRQVSYRPLFQGDSSIYVSVYGFGREISYAYPAGMKCDPIGLPHISTYDVFVMEGVDAFAQVEFNRTGGNLAIRSRAFAATRQIADPIGAVAGSDFQSVPLTRIVFAPNTVDARRGSPLSIAILDDTEVERTEYFELSFFIDSQADSGGYAFPSNVARVTILDNDGGSECSFLKTDYTVLESTAAYVFITILTNDVSLRNSCVLTTVDGTAVAGSDYVEYDEAVEFLGVMTRIGISIVNDITEELDEFFRIQLSSRAANVVISGPNVATVRILNDDIVFFYFFNPSIFVNETEKSAALTIVKRGVADHDVNVTFATSSITAKEEDYNATFLDVTFQADEKNIRADEENITILVPIEDDDLYELDEEFGASLARLVDGRQRILSKATIRIASDETAFVGFEYSSYTIRESDGSVNICVVLSTTARSLEDTVGVNIVTEEVTAGNTDFRRFSDRITFRQSDRKWCISVSIIDNNIYESDETFNVQIRPTAEALPEEYTGLVIGTSIAEVNILDDDELLIGFVNSIYRVEENAGSATVRLGILNRIETAVNVSVELFFLNGDNDSTFEPQAFFFYSLARTAIQITILDDFIPEVNESVQAGLRFMGDVPIPRVTLAPARTTIQIVDDDTIIRCFPRFGCNGRPVEAPMSRCCRHALSPFGVSYTDLEARPGIGQCIRCPVEFGFLHTTIEGQESTTPYKVQIGFLSGSSEFGGVRVTVSVTENENDVVISSRDIIVLDVSPQYHAATLEIVLKPDNIALEEKEEFLIEFTHDPEAFGESAIVRHRLQGFIIDANTPTFQLSTLSCRATESEAVVPVTIEKTSNVLLDSEALFYLIINETSLSEEIEPLNPFAPNRADDSDLLNHVKSFSFPADQEGKSFTVDIPIVNDDINEATKFFSVDLVAFGERSELVTVEQASIICKIIDDDELQIEFEEDQYFFFEPDTPSLFNFTLIKKNNRQTEQTFGIAVSFGDPGHGLRPATLLQNETSTINADYMVDIPETITFEPHESRVTISFMLLPDEVVEGSEGFTASIRSHGDPYPDFLLPVSSSILAKALVVVLDNDYVYVGFERPSYTVNEANGTVAICVQLHNGTDMLNFSVALFYSTERETADVFDFEEIPGTARQLLIIGAEAASSCIDITITDDIIVEETESFTLKLEVARDSDRESVRFVNQIATIAIKDNDESVNDHSIVSCFPTMDCGGISELKKATLFDCCQHGVQPFGLSFIIPEQDGCQLCPVEFGFLEREFSGIERSEEYTANLTFISGNVHLGDGFVVNITLIPDNSTDIVLTTPQVLITRIYPSNDLQLFPVSFICKEDRVAQEWNETFTLAIEFDPVYLGATSASTLRNTFTGSIQDSTYVTFQLSQSEYKEFENLGDIPVEITKISDVILANSVSFMILPLTIDEALSRDVISQDVISSFEESTSHSFSPYRADFLDFDNRTISVQFPAGEGKVNIVRAISIVDDSINEANFQVFIAHLIVESAVNKDQILLNRATSNCVIIDNDSIQIGFQRSSYKFLEPDDAKASFENVTLIKENGRISEQTFGILITFSEPGPGTNVATRQEVGLEIEFDFLVSSPGNDTTVLYFYPNQSEITFPFCVVPDDLVEGTEGFRASIASLGAPFPDFEVPQFISFAAPSFRDTTIKILDRSDFAVLGFEELVYNVSEKDRGVEICVNVTNPPPSENLALNITLEYRTMRDSASNNDFRERPGGVSARFISFRMSESVRRKCFNIVVFQDLLYERTERFLVTLSPIEGTDSIIIEPQNTEVFISDDDELYLGISEKQLQQVEQDVLEFNLLSNQTTEVSVFLTVHIFDITNQTSLSIMTQEINAARPYITISWESDDLFVELDESILVELSFFGPPPPRVNITTESVVVTIVDDDSLWFLFAPSDVFTVEGTEDFANFSIAMVGFPGNLSFVLVLSINDTSSTATAGIDFDFSFIELKFSSSVNAHDISIGIINDDLNEFEEHFEVFVSDVIVLDSFGDEIKISNDERSRIVTNETTTIVIRDKVQFRFSENSYVVNEGVGMITLQVMKEGFATEESSVQINTEDGSASSVNDSDFVGVSRNLTFSVNENEKSVIIEITDDNMLEGNETFLAILSEVSEAGDEVMLANVTVTIEDNDATITMSSLPATNDNMQTFPLPMPESQGVLEISLGIFGVLALLTLIVVVLVILYLLYRRKHVKKKNISLTETDEHVRGLKHFTVQTSFRVDIPHSLFIVSSNLKLGTTLGQGEFGVVYKGYLKTGISDIIKDTVAVKTLKGFVQKELVRDLLKECGRMYKFDHPNVLTLLGVCMDGGPAPFIIMPYMANGSLLAYLKNERENLLLSPESAKPEDAEVVEKKLLDMCIQVAKGMEYLASKRVIHRDLAARNCMIDINFVIKVADFGLAESMDSSKDYFRQNHEDIIKLPIKWLSLESIHDGVFSEKSDVWSYGVTCWEVFNGGKTPYPGIYPVDLAQHLDGGLRLEKPVNAACSEEIYSFMLKCWDAEPHPRPTFAELVEQLSEMLGVMAGYLEFSAPDRIAETKV